MAGAIAAQQKGAPSALASCAATLNCIVPAKRTQPSDRSTVEFKPIRESLCGQTEWLFANSRGFYKPPGNCRHPNAFTMSALIILHLERFTAGDSRKGS